MSYLAFGTSNISLHRFTLGWAFHSLPKPPFSWFVRMTAQGQAIACASCQGLCRANKKAHEGAVAMKEDRQVAETNTIYNQRKKLYPKANNRDINWQTQWWPNKQPPNSQQSCKFCLQLHLRGAQNCPAWTVLIPAIWVVFGNVKSIQLVLSCLLWCKHMAGHLMRNQLQY